MVVCRDFNDDVFDKDSAVTVGTFDGVHLGHRQIISALSGVADENKLRKVVVTFEPHPRIVLDKFSNVKLLSSTEEKLSEFERLGVDLVILINFNESFAVTSAVDFYKNILIERIGLAYLVVGYDHMFGKNREGSLVTIKSLSDIFNFNVKRVDAFRFDDKIISSSVIRSLIKKGDVHEAAKLLGRDYKIHGTVIYGDKRGRTIGFPTANIEINDEHKLIPAAGVYKVNVLIGSERFTGMMNIGLRPTIDPKNIDKLFLEVHIAGFNRDIYGNEITIEFVEFIRSEMKFNSIDDLISQLKKDKEYIFKN